MKYEIEYNARSLPAEDIAKTFVLPESYFSKLISRNHVLLLGPRGSGKTTLLKMLTVRALRNWSDVQIQNFGSKILFNSVFIPADIAWGEQIKTVSKLDFNSKKKEVAFVIHTLRSLIFAMRESVELGRSEEDHHLSHLAVKLSNVQEEEFVRQVSKHYKIAPVLNSLLGVELALEAILDPDYLDEAADSFGAESFWPKIIWTIKLFNGMSGNDSRRWALLFDELEIAPTKIKNFLLSGIRSVDQRIIVKLAMAPYMGDTSLSDNPTSPHTLHDFQTIPLTYPKKSDGADFSTELMVATLERFGIENFNLERFFKFSNEVSHFGRAMGKARRKSGIPEEFISLASKDESFKEYVEKHRLHPNKFKFSDQKNAQFIRKIMPIVIARDFFLKSYAGEVGAHDRSRKQKSLYLGFPTLRDLTEGNPRAILTLLGPMAQQYVQDPELYSERLPVPMNMREQGMKRIELLLTSLLQVIPLDLPGFKAGKGLLDFVDYIGRCFERRLLGGAFSADYVGTFVLNDKFAPEIAIAIGKAINTGALIHVPYDDGGPDSLVRGLVGQRFRISYSLTSRYRLLPSLGAQVSLLKLAEKENKLPVLKSQATLFEVGSS